MAPSRSMMPQPAPVCRNRGSCRPRLAPPDPHLRSPRLRVLSPAHADDRGSFTLDPQPRGTAMKVAVVTFSLLLAAAPARGAEPEGKPTVVPAVLRSIAPMGVVRGGTATFTLDGERLAGATGVFFDDAAITGRVLP